MVVRTVGAVKVLESRYRIDHDSYGRTQQLCIPGLDGRVMRSLLPLISKVVVQDIAANVSISGHIVYESIRLMDL